MSEPTSLAVLLKIQATNLVGTVALKGFTSASNVVQHILTFA